MPYHATIPFGGQTAIMTSENYIQFVIYGHVGAAYGASNISILADKDELSEGLVSFLCSTSRT